MKKTIALLLIILLGFSALAESGFAYEHDPRDNPNAMKDIVENPDAVYGFSPSPDSTRLKDYVDALDWTYPEQVAEARATRQAYHDSLSELYRMIEDMLHEGKDVETIARAVSQRRNELRLEAEADDPEALALTKKSNLETYGNEFGPTADSLYEKYGSWQTVLEKALGTNAGMDACLGFYDEYYDLYDIDAAAPADGDADAPAANPDMERFSLWNPEAPALGALVEYLEAVTDEASPDYIPAEERIAVFDLDGTLMCETYPFCFEYMVFADYALNHADAMPEEVLAVAREIVDAAGGAKPSGMSERQAAAAAVAYKGMTMEELAQIVEDFKASEAWGFTGMTRGEAWYRPMVQLVEQLQANGFTVYIVTATERNIVRQVIAGTLNIPPSQVIGTEYGYAATNQGDAEDTDYTFQPEDKIVFDGSYLSENAKTSKVDAIVREIGRQPVLAFGNSTGDLAMAVYTISNNPCKSAAYMVLSDDDAREWGDAEAAAEKKATYEAMGIGTISMRDDFLTIYGDGVAKDPLARYSLEQVVILSRHNLRAPLSSNGSVPNELTPHDWIKWSAGSSELTLKGGVEEASMGQYFMKWLDREGLIPQNYVPEPGEVRFNARDKQRCIATARYFAAGMLPLADIEVEHPGDAKGTQDFMQPVLHFYSDAYAADATSQVAAMGGDAGFDGLAEQNRGVIKLIMDTVDMQDSEVYQSGKYGDLLADGFGYAMAADKEPDITGAIKPAYQVADALLLQYYEEPDATRAAFGHALTDEDWATLGKFMTTCLEMKHGAPLVSVNITNPLLRELEGELQNGDRKFSFFCAHDCTVLGALSALGAEDFALPGSIETKAPIGVKIVFERRRDAEGQAWYRVSMIYRSTEQIRSGEMLTLENPPLRYDLSFEGVETNADGLISEADLIALFDRSIAAFDDLEDAYALADAA